MIINNFLHSEKSLDWISVEIFYHNFSKLVFCIDCFPGEQGCPSCSYAMMSWFLAQNLGSGSIYLDSSEEEHSFQICNCYVLSNRPGNMNILLQLKQVGVLES